MRTVLWVLALTLAGWAHAGEIEHASGDFKYAVGPEPEFVVRHPVPDTWDAGASGANEAHWRTWLYDEQADHRGGRDLAYVEYAYEAKSQSLIGEAGRFTIEFNPAYQRLTIHRVELRRGGQWQDRLRPERISLARRESGFEENMADGVVTALIVLDDVRVDDVVRIGYSVAGSNPILAGQTADWTQLGWRNPILDVYLRSLEDPGSKLRFHRENFAVDPVVRTDAQATEATLHSHAMAAIVDEKDYPIWYQPYPLIQIAKDRNWSDVVTWALPLYPQVENLPADLETRLQQWSQIADPYMRLDAALRAVQDEVRYFGVEMGENTHRPTAPAETWRRRYGDCKDKTYLLVTLLERLKLRAVPALVSTARGRAVADFVPAASVFDHVVVRVTIGKQVLWVDPTIAQQRADARDFDMSGYGVALPIFAGNKGLETIVAAPRTRGGVHAVERYVPSPGAREVRLTVETTYAGNAADRARRSIASERADERERRYAEYYRKRYGDVDVVDKAVLSDDPKANTLKITETYLLKSPFEKENAVTEAIDVHAEVLEGMATLPPSMSRKGPLDFGLPADYTHEIEIRLPEHWKPGFDNESSHFASPAFDYSRELKVSPDAVKIIYHARINQPEIDAANVGAHLGELRKMRDDLYAHLRFRIPAEGTSAQRDERLKALLQNVLDDDGKNE